MNAYHIAAAAVLAAIASAAGAQEAPVRFERDGKTYVYTTQQAGPRTVISGRTYPNGARFRLIVRNETVTGAVDGRPVAFRIADARGAATVLAATN